MRCVCSDENCLRRFSGSPKRSFSSCSKSFGMYRARAIEVPRKVVGESARSMHMQSFADFWPDYVRAHSRERTRVLHAIGSVLAVVMLGLAFAVSLWFLIGVPLVGYA